MDDRPRKPEGSAEAEPSPARRVYCNRTLNLRTIRAVGYDMDYTLVHYRNEEWERRAFAHLRLRVLRRGWPADGLAFDPTLFVRGLVVDLQLGNLVKANRFGYVKRACHGTRMLEYDEQRRFYGRAFVDLREERWVFLNTLFSLSEASMFAQLVQRHDATPLPGVRGYDDLYRGVRELLDQAHLEGALKAEIVADPDRFVESDPDMPRALVDQRQAGKRLLLITNSDWPFTRAMMSYAVDRFLPRGRTWRDLFEIVLVSARKPDFFSVRLPLFEIVDEEAGLLRPCVEGLRAGRAYAGGDANLVEDYLGMSGEEILFVGDHLFSDVNVSKNLLRWRTALILRELETEIDALDAFRPREAELAEAMAEKERLEARLCRARLLAQRLSHGEDAAGASAEGVQAEQAELRARIEALDARIAPLARQAGETAHSRWGPIFRAGNDKSHLARQVERYADLYTSRVSNFLHVTPFAYLRAPRGTLPHDGAAGGSPLEG